MARALLLTRRSIAAGALAAVIAQSARAQASALNFLVVGDWGQPHSAIQRTVAAAMGQVAAEISSDFVISTGDNFYDDGVGSVRDPQWRRSFEDVYTAPALQTPWYAVLGNHDYQGSPQAEIDFTANDPRWRMRARFWREEMPLPDGGAAHLFFIDTTPLVGLGAAIPPAVQTQLDWLVQELAAATAGPRLVIGHHPIRSAGQHGDTPALVRLLLPVLQAGRANAYFHGHDHALQHIDADGLHYICSGAGAEATQTRTAPGLRFALSRPGFAACALTQSSLRLGFRDADGASVYATDIQL